jgi:hypothetical protein
LSTRGRPQVTGFLIDDGNEDKFARHGLRYQQILQILEIEYVILRNRAGRRAPYLAIGRDNSGMCVTVPIEPITDPTMWRPVTAWACKRHERALLTRG